VTTGQFSNFKFCGTIVLGLEASFYYCGCVLRKDITMRKDTKRDMGKEELEVEVDIVEVEADKSGSDKTETVKEDSVEEKAIALTPEQAAFLEEKSVPKKYDRTLDPVFKYFFGRECN
jgi:hypothetical protein